MSEAVEPARSGHRNAFGFLRLLFASLVIASHVPEIVDGDRHRELLTRAFGTMTFGELAVHGFFVISGFLISASFLSSQSTGDYLLKRVARIYPAFLFASLLGVVVEVPFGGVPLRELTAGYIRDAVAHAVLLDPLPNPGAFAGSHFDELNGAMWTIRYEFRCYLLVILLGWAGLLRRPAVLGGAAIVLVAASPLASGDANTLPPWLHLQFWLGLPNEAMLLTGMFLAGAAIRAVQDRLPVTAWTMTTAAAVLIAGLFSPLLARLAVASAGAYLIYGAATLGRGTLLERINNRNDVSYGVYLYAWPVEKMLIAAGMTGSLLGLGAAVWVIAVVLGAASWFLLEKPVLALLRQRAVLGRRLATG